MSVINQVLRDLDARGAAAGADRYNPWSPDADRQGQEARFFAYPARQQTRPDSAWRRPVTLLLMALLLVMLLGAPWLSQLIAQGRALDPTPLARSAPTPRLPATAAAPLTASAEPQIRTASTTATTRRAPATNTDKASRPKLASSTPATLPLENLPPPAAGRTQAAPRRSPSMPTDAMTRLAPASALEQASTPKAAATVEKTLAPLSPTQRAQASYAQAVESTQSGRTLMALTQAQEALRHQPGHQPARHLAAVMLHESARTDQAVELLREGLSLNPQADALSLLLARLQAHQGTLDAALHTLDQHQLHTLDAETLRAGLWSQLRQYKQAASAFEAALQKQPGQATLWMGWGVALEGDGQGDAARKAFARAQAIGLPDPELSAFVAQRLKALE